MKKILHVTGAMNVGGTETMLINLYRKLNRKIQFNFISYSKNEAYYDKEIEELGGKIIKLSSPNEVGFIRAIKDIRKVIRENGPYEAVHTHMMFNCGVAMIAAYMEGIKVRVSHAHTTADNSISLLRKLYISLMRILIRIFSTNFLACSNGAGQYLFGNNIVENKRYKILPNFIDYEKFIICSNENNIRKELNINNNDIVVCHIGRFIEAKNHKFLIDVVNEMIVRNHNVKLLLVGKGDFEDKIREKVNKLGIEKNIYFLDVRKDIPNILSKVDLFVLPSIHEGLGLVLLEAQASKVPCLVSEAIQSEVDLDIDLINKLNLSDGSKKWAEEAFRIIKEKNINEVDVMKAVKSKKYDLDSIVSNLISVYKLNLE